MLFAIAVTALTRLPALKLAAGLIGKGAAATVVAGAASAAAGSIVSQGIAVATGIQDKFSWNAVGLAAIGGGVGASGVGDIAAKSIGFTGNAIGAVGTSLNSALTQGIGVATGLQDKFDWAGVAAAGVGSYVGAKVGGLLPTNTPPFAANLVASTASALANAATRSLIDGSDFGDNILAALPDVLGQTIGGAFSNTRSGRGSIAMKPLEGFAPIEKQSYAPIPELANMIDMPSFSLATPHRAQPFDWSRVWDPSAFESASPAGAGNTDYFGRYGRTSVSALDLLDPSAARQAFVYRMNEASGTLDAANQALGRASRALREGDWLGFLANEGQGLLLTLGGVGQATTWPFAGSLDLLNSAVGGRGFHPNDSDRYDSDFVLGTASLATGVFDIAGAARVAGVGTRVVAAEAADTVTVYRVQGGPPQRASRRLIQLDSENNVTISNKTLNVSLGDPTHAGYFLSKRPGGEVVSFEIPRWMGDFIESEAIPQFRYRTNPLNQGGLAPKIVDASTPGISYELPPPWAKWLEETAISGSGRVEQYGGR